MASELMTSSEGISTNIVYAIRYAQVDEVVAVCILAASHADNLYGSISAVNDIVADALIVEVLRFCLNTAAQNC